MGPHGNRRAPLRALLPVGMAEPRPDPALVSRYPPFPGTITITVGDDGLPLMNLTDVPPLAGTRIQAATTRTTFGEIALYGEEAVLRGRRVGNVILLAGNVPMIRPGNHERVVRGGELTNFLSGARPLLDEPR